MFTEPSQWKLYQMIFTPIQLWKTDYKEMKSLKVFELYSGIGGMHFALKESQLDAEVTRAIDINPCANLVYKCNFPGVTLLEKNIQGLLPKDFNKHEIDMIMMSPPCQPFTRNGLRKDSEDLRNSSLLHIISLIPKMETVNYILLENVQGFEYSNIRNKLVQSLMERGFVFQEFLLSPDQFSVPNSRLRYYLLAKKTPLGFCFEKKDEIMTRLPCLKADAAQKICTMNMKYKTLAGDDSCFKLEVVLGNTGGEMLTENVLIKYGNLLDIVTSKGTRTCCFTKSYGRYIEGTGSVFSPVSPDYMKTIFKELEKFDRGNEEYINLMKLLKLRYFSPEEVSRLMCFPNTLQFPGELTNRQKYKLLGNSINVHVMAILTVLLVS